MLLLKSANKLKFKYLIDAEYEFVGMGNRHVPTKCIALGTWDNPGKCFTLSAKDTVDTKERFKFDNFEVEFHCCCSRNI